MDGENGDLNKGRTRENDPADIAQHHNPARELPELRLPNQTLALKAPSSEGRATDNGFRRKGSASVQLSG